MTQDDIDKLRNVAQGAIESMNYGHTNFEAMAWLCRGLLDALAEVERLTAAEHKLKTLISYNIGTTDVEPHEALRLMYEEGQRRLNEVERLTPKWQEGEPPDGPVWREGVAYPVRVKRSERYGLMYWDDGFRSWKADYGEPQPRWAPIPKPTEG